MKYTLLASLLAALALLHQEAATPVMKLPEVGKPAPSFRLNDQSGRTVSVGGKYEKWTALVFYPKAMTSGCTQEVCSLRDAEDAWREAGLEVYGLSLDSVEDQAAFAEKHELPFALLSDPDASVAVKYGVLDPTGKFTQRLTFLIDEQGVLRQILDEVSVKTHGADVAALVKKLKG